jgi:uncharacterized protein (TIGR03435 family)
VLTSRLPSESALSFADKPSKKSWTLCCYSSRMVYGRCDPALRIALMSLLFVIGFLHMPYAQGQSNAPRAEFEVATIKLSLTCISGGGHEQLSPGRFGVECVSLRDYIRVAFGAFGSGPNPGAKPPEVLGGPAWLDTDRYDIIAKASGDTGLDEMYGPMMQSLLQDRFQLKLHTEVRDLPVYLLTLNNRLGKLTPVKEGSCVPIDLKQVLKSPPPENYCGRMTTKRGTNTTFDGYGITMVEFANRIFKDALDRPVLDRSGLSGRFDIHFGFVANDALVSPDDVGPSIFTALREQLGLKLSAAKGPVEVLVIDHVERPSGN